MKRAIAMLSFVFLLAPSFALADDQATATPAPMAAPARPTQAQRDAIMTAMRQTHTQMKALHDQEHARLLAALTPAQRTTLALTLGNLALSTKPDHTAAAAKLDAALSASQRASILKIASDYRAKTKTLMAAAQAKLLANMPAEARARMDAAKARMQARGDQNKRSSHHKRTPSAGRILLAMGSHQEFPGMHSRGGPGMLPGRRMRAPGMPPGGPGARMHDGAPGRMAPAAPAASPTP